MSKPTKADGFIPRSRLEGLTDGVFAFAMTLLVVNIELPEGFEPKTDREFLDRLSGLSDTLIAYLITFFVLVSFWFGRAKQTGEPEMTSGAYAWAVLLHLLSVTFLPFSMRQLKAPGAGPAQLKARLEDARARRGRFAKGT